MSNYAAQVVRTQLDSGPPCPEEGFYRVKVGRSVWFNVTPEELERIAEALEGSQTPA